MKRKNIAPAEIICHVVLWCLALCGMLLVFDKQSEPLYRKEEINDALGETIPLYPGDVLCQTFQIKNGGLESMAVAVAYDAAAGEQGSLDVRFYYDDGLIVEQPLPLTACPQETFLEFSLQSQKLGGGILVIQIENTSEEENGVFSVLSTQNFYAYTNYSEGCRINGGETQDRSILCSLKFRTGKNYYKGLTNVFFVFLAAVILSRLLTGVFAWRQRHTVR